MSLPKGKSLAPTPVVKLFCFDVAVAPDDEPVKVLPTVKVEVSVVVCSLAITSFFAPISWSTNLPVVLPDVIVSPIVKLGVVVSE